jgi:putative oxidoreductase
MDMQVPQTEARSTRLLLPGLAGFYRWVEPVSWLIVRLAIGFNLVMHGAPKLPLGPTAYAGRLAQLGLPHSELFAWADILIEFVGGLGIMLGLFTRFCAAAVAIEMAFIMVMYIPNGFSWLGRGYEYVLMWGLVSFAIALRGGGPYSVDRRIGVEL